jgi:hypothetical protein
MTPGQAAHGNQEQAQARSGGAAAGSGTVTLLPTRAREVVADEDHASARSGTARLRPRRTARLRDVSRDVQLDVTGRRSLAPDHDAPGAGRGAEGIKDLAVTLGEQLLLAAALSQWNRVEALATQVRAVARLVSAHNGPSGTAGPNLTGPSCGYCRYSPLTCPCPRSHGVVSCPRTRSSRRRYRFTGSWGSLHDARQWPAPGNPDSWKREGRRPGRLDDEEVLLVLHRLAGDGEPRSVPTAYLPAVLSRRGGQL